MRSINRSAIIVRPKQPFLTWAAAVDGKPAGDLPAWTSVYLVADSPGPVDKKAVEKHFPRIFEEQLESWYRLESRWPSPRTFQLFQEWFAFDCCDLVLDLSKAPIGHDA